MVFVCEGDLNLLKRLSLYFSFSIVNAGITFLTSVFLARNLSVEDFGVIGLFLAVLYFAKPLASFNAVGLVSINKANFNKERFKSFSDVYFSFQIMFFVFLLLISLVLSQVFYEYMFIFLILPFLIFVMVFTEFHYAELVQEKNSLYYGGYIFVTRILVLMFSSLLINLYDFNWKAYLWALFLSEIIVLVVTMKITFVTLRGFKFTIEKNEIRRIIIFGLPLFIFLIAGWGLNQADKFIVLHYFSIKEVAFYTVAYSLGVSINTVNQALKNSILPMIYNALKEGRAEGIIRKYTLYYTAFITLCIVILGCSASYFVPVFYGEEYSSSISIVVLISIAFGFNGLYRITGMILEYHKLNVLKTKLVFSSMLINIFLSIMLIDGYGVLAPAIGTIVAYMYLAFSSQYYGNKILKVAH